MFSYQSPLLLLKVSNMYCYLQLLITTVGFVVGLNVLLIITPMLVLLHRLYLYTYPCWMNLASRSCQLVSSQTVHIGSPNCLGEDVNLVF